ncbi:glycosyltransferase family A protein [Mucilaginibacter gynuensis]|uniref:Glycosyltransferase family A protein n=1 Tax=Mucilaginibacter gynuensis TaxID=1302236 RepID=A0ABP8GQ37_9SPHI
MTGELISIIIPVYNAEKHLKACIESALAQTWPYIELIIIDDGSTDGSLTIARSFESPIVKIYSTINKGASAARNLGIQHANGNYIQFLDADDLLSPDKMEQQVNSLQQNPDKVAVCSTIYFNNGDDHLNSPIPTYEEAFLQSDDSPAHFLINLWGGYSTNGSMVQPNAWLVPKVIINRADVWNEALTVDDDGEYFCRVLLQSAGIIKTGGLNYYRKYPGTGANLSAAKQEKHFASQLQAFKLKYQWISKNDDSANLKTAYLRSLHQLKFKVYPNYPQLLLQIDEAIAAIPYSITYHYTFATPAGNAISKLLGWRFTKILQNLVHQLKA